jgi:gas vesicle protein
MANGYYRVDQENSGGSFLMGLVTGTLLGAGLGILFAPRAGADLRREIGEQAGNLASDASETYRKASQGASDLVAKAQGSASDWAGKATGAADDLAERGKELYGKAREAFVKGSDEAQRYVRDSSSRVAPFPATSNADPSSTGQPSSGTGSSPSGDGSGVRS